jgi:hypothetical protein
VVETRSVGFLACVDCARLRPAAAFSTKMVKKRRAAGGIESHNRFCIECGLQPLPGIHRYTLDSRWEDHGVPFVRCLRCRSIARAPEDTAVKLCLSCNWRDLERARARQEQERVWMMIAEQKERRLLRAGRRQNWIDIGGTPSDYSSENTTSEQQDRQNPWDQGQDDDMNYSAHS